MLRKTPVTDVAKPPPSTPNRCAHQVSNAMFISEVFRQVPVGAHAAVCSKRGDPTEGGGWPAHRADSGVELPNDMNNYLSCSSFRLFDDGQFNVRKAQLAGYHFLLLDDLGRKVSMDKLGDFELSWKIETSPGNFQAGIILAEPITDQEEADRLIKSLITAGLSDEGASGVSRWARLPNAINGKREHRVDGRAFQCRLAEWRPEKRYSVGEIVRRLKLKLAEPPIGTAPKNLARLNQRPAPPCRKVVAALVAHICPDCGYDSWLRVLAAIFHESGGAEDGFALAIAWSRTGRKYKGAREVRQKWNSFRLDHPNPCTLATLCWLVKQSGGDPVAILAALNLDFAIIEGAA